MKEIESVMMPTKAEHADGDYDVDEDLSSDTDMDDPEDSDFVEDEDEQTDFMNSYSNALTQELKSTTLDKSFVRPNETPIKKDEGASRELDGEDFTPVDVDLNLVKSFLVHFLLKRDSRDLLQIFLVSWAFNSHKMTTRTNDTI